MARKNQEEINTQVLDNQSRAAAMGITIPGVTPAKVYKDTGINTGSFKGSIDDRTDTALEQDTSRARRSANQNISERDIFNSQLNLYQGQIDATNQIYAQKLGEARTQGISNLGSERAMQARGGLLGSDFAGAQNALVTTQNTGRESSIQAEQSARIGAIMGLVRQDAADELAAKRADQEKGSATYIRNLKTLGDRKAAYVAKTAASFLDQEINSFEDIDPLTIKEIAKMYRVPAEDFKSAYMTEQKRRDVEVEKLRIEGEDRRLKAIKDNSFNLSEGQSRYTYDPETGAYNLTASKAKTYAPSSGGGGGGAVGAGTSGQIIGANGRPLKLTVGQVDTVRAFEDTLGAAQQALALLASGVQTGPLQNVGLQGAKFAGNANPEQLKLEQLIGKLKADFIKSISGAAASESEVNRLAKFLPDIGDQENVIKSKLNTLLSETQRSRQNFLSTLGATQSATAAPTQTASSVEDPEIDAIAPDGTEGTVAASEAEYYRSQGYTVFD